MDSKYVGRAPLATQRTTGKQACRVTVFAKPEQGQIKRSKASEFLCIAFCAGVRS